MMASFNTDIQFLKGVGEKRANTLKSRGIDTVGALLRYFPRSYIDFSDTKPISECPFNENVCVKARLVTAVKEERKRPGMILYSFIADDGESQMYVTLFNQKYLAAKLNKGSEYLFYGKMGGSFIMRQMNAPEITETGYSGIHPVYRAIGQLSSKVIERLMENALLSELEQDSLPETVRESNNLCDIKFALENIHFPRTPESLERAKKRLVFEELFILQAGLTMLKGNNRSLSGAVVKKDYTTEFQNMLPFELTYAQQRVINECTADMMSGRLMNRLVQGDVGSGKTAVAAALCYNVVKNGFQAAFMAPTEILAEQHYNTLLSQLNDSGIKIGMLTGSLTKKQKDAVKAALKNGEIDIIVGTHALLTDDVVFNKLGLAVTDEQHRFGVAQRARLAAKGDKPHTLVMSATPIPRTLALIVYGDLDISIIDEYPKGRQQIATYTVDSGYHERIYKYIKKHLDEGRQAYIVCPLVEENEGIELKSAEEYYDELRNGEFKNYSTGLLHGKMPAKQKDSVMRDFKDGKIQLLVSTTVIEVGIDVPNAVLMVIENAERFGLSQLHQLRGRIGRGKYQSCCILVSDYHPERLQVIRGTNDGFKIADEDLKLRGPGDFLGNRQHGLPDLKIADIYADSDVLRKAGLEVQALLKQDPGLEKQENAALKTSIEALYEKMIQN